MPANSGFNGKTISKNHKPSTITNLFPNERKGSLDVDVLKKLGMKKKVLDEDNFLFFYQLILPICDPKKSGVEDDPQKAYYSQVECWSNNYVYSI